ncbi:DnaJ-like protein [Dunaliella salina]|uniref:DnaJ-like protein n=1 Tax=Dunaliella salina TaxID=3046 RepID=A0ABQ7G643_DUNSA|nr:DnaJ-like protein [Dunaliella salina]|eukprot:KAF5830077.1 DnaJ-like protein [Dunaliella salina]
MRRGAAVLLWVFCLQGGFLTLCTSAEQGEDKPSSGGAGGAAVHLGDEAFSAGNFGMAIQFYTSAIEADSKSSLLFTKRAAAYISMRHQAQALRDLDTSVELDSRYIQGYITRGKLLKQMCSLEAAERDFKAVLEHRPGHKTATQELNELEAVHSALAVLNAAMSAQKYVAARKALEGVYEHAQDCVQAQLLEAELNMKDNKYDEVVAVSGNLLKSQPKNLQALILRGKAYFYLHDHDLAKRHFGEALKYDPDCKDAKTEFNRVKTYDKTRTSAERALEAKDWAEAEATFIKGLNLDPEHRRGNAGLWHGLAKARSALGRHLLAAEAYDAVAVLAEGDLEREARAAQVRALLAAEDWQQAVNKARAAAQQYQGSREFRMLYAEAEKRLKMSKRKDYYKILGVEKSADEKEIKRAYRELAKKYHPDKVEADKQEEAAKAFHEIAEAAEVLADEEKRTRWENGEDLEDMGGASYESPFTHFGGFRSGGRQEFHFRWG